IFLFFFFSLLGYIDANEFEKKHFENLSRRHENAVRISEAVKKVNIERAIVELQERKAIKDLVRLSLDNKAIAALSQSTSVTESTLTRRSVTLTSTEIRKLAEDAVINKRKLGKVVSKPELPFTEQESDNIVSERKSLSSGVILSSRHHARIIETQITDMLFVSDNNVFPVVPQSGIPSATSSVVPRLDFSAFEDSVSNKPIELVANVEQSRALEDIVIPDVDTDVISKPQSKESRNDKSERSDGRTSRDVSSISEFEPPPASVERTSNDDKKTENDASTIKDIEESVHDDDSTLTQNSTTNHAEPKPIEQLHTATEVSIFSELPTLTHSRDDLQSLPEPLSAKDDKSESKHENREEEIKETLPVIEHPNADSDPERLPLSATTAGTFNASPISSSRLLGDSPIPSPPFVQPSVSSALKKEAEMIKPIASEDLLAEEEKSISEASNLQSVFSSKSSTESSRVVVPSSLENS
uniref:Uncharacterized protein n=1 Tax=Panagrolaimus sp. PS1159 TaxID=55785 RepID=A0AC35FC24_9BILA